MPFQAATSQPQMMNAYHMSREYAHIWRSALLTGSPAVPDGYAHNIAFGQPYVQQPQGQQPQHPQQQQPQQPQRGHPIPSPSPVNAAMVIQVQDPSAKAPSAHVPNPAAAPFKPRPKKMALLQDPNTMEVVDLSKPTTTDPAATTTASTTTTSVTSSQRSTPSVDSAADQHTADSSVPEPAKHLPNVSRC